MRMSRRRKKKESLCEVIGSGECFEMWWFQQGVSFLPSALIICCSSSFVFSYIIAVLLHHVDPLVPSISDSGVLFPERCIFGILLNFASVFGAASIYVRYKQVSTLNPEEPKILRLNKVGLMTGMVSCFGLCIVANFQQNVDVPIHETGSFLVFGIGIIYVLIQTIISYKMQPRIHGKGIVWIRLTILLWCILSIISLSTSTVILVIIKGADCLVKRHWDPQERGYALHIFNTISEWSLVLFYLIFFLTFIRDFQKIAFNIEARLLAPNLYDEQEPLLADDQEVLVTRSI